MGNLMDWFYGQIVGFLGNFFAIMGGMGVELFELTWVQSMSSPVIKCKKTPRKKCSFVAEVKGKR